MRKMLLFVLVTTILFSFTASAESRFAIVGNNVNLRSGPYISDDNVIRKLNHNGPITILSITDSLDFQWCYVVLSDNTTGYVASQYIGSIYVGIPAIVTNNVNMREGPSTECSSYGVIPKYTIVKIIDMSDEWCYAQYAGRLGYISSQYLRVKTFYGENLLGSFTTSFSSSQKGRTKNIKKAAGLINEYIISPGSTFSLLSAIGPITREGGYFEAPEYKVINGVSETVTGYGGGVCQIATTLYQSIAASIDSSSNIKIIERNHHSKSVSYIPNGQDATISWASKKDFKFKNNNSYPLKIRTFVYKNSLSCMIFELNY